MPVNEIEMTIPLKSVRNADTEVVVKAGGRKLGSLRLSQDAIAWDPASRSESVSLTWERFSKLMVASRAEEMSSAPVRATRKRAPTAAPRAAAKPSRRRGRGARRTVDASVVREWANVNGIAVSARGRLRADVVAAYHEAN